MASFSETRIGSNSHGGVGIGRGPNSGTSGTSGPSGTSSTAPGAIPSALADEIEALQSIYDQSSLMLLPASIDFPGGYPYTVIYKPTLASDPTLGGLFTAKFGIPEDYPNSSSSTVFQLSCHTTTSGQCLSASQRAQIVAEVQEAILQNMGAEVLFIAIDLIRTLAGDAIQLFDDSGNDHINGDDSWDDSVHNNAEPDAGDVYHYSAYSAPNELNLDEPVSNLRIIHGEVTVERKSSFQSHFMKVASMDDVRAFREEVLSEKRVARATHNIFAYRFTCQKTGVVYHDNDDDGETAAGGRLAEMIRLMEADGIAVIVSRWFGGVLLGPDRFKLICNSARNLLEAHGIGVGVSVKGKQVVK